MMADPATPGTLGEGIAPAPLVRLPPIGFWSYSRQDDELSKSKLSNLRGLVMAEIQQQYGRDRVQLFQDVGAIPHGAAWEREIRNSLNNSTFFIPIVTPNFIQSEWCSTEVSIFLERERQLLADHPDLPRRSRIFPVLLIDVAGIDPHDQQVLAALQRLQWFDFRHLRHRDFEHESVQQALSQFAASIRDLLYVKVRSLVAEPARQAEQARREAAATAARQEPEAAAPAPLGDGTLEALKAQLEEERRQRQRDQANAETARIEAERAAEALRSARAETVSADAEWAAGGKADTAPEPYEGISLAARWRDAAVASRIAVGMIIVSILVIGIVALLSLGGGEEKMQTASGASDASNPAASRAPAEGAAPPSLSAPLPGGSGAATAPAGSQPSYPPPAAGEAQAPANAADRPPIARPVARAAVPARVVAAAISADDYPASALRAESEGTTGISYTIGPTGRATNCSVTSSSGDASLDAATCRIILTRLRATPARDSQGRPTSQRGSTRVTWRLPAD